MKIRIVILIIFIIFITSLTAHADNTTRYNVSFIVKDRDSYSPLQGVQVTFKGYYPYPPEQVKYTNCNGRAGSFLIQTVDNRCVAGSVKLTLSGYESEAKQFNICNDGHVEVITMRKRPSAYVQSPNNVYPSSTVNNSPPVEKTQNNFAAEAITGTLVIISTPLGAKVTIDGEKSSVKTPLKLKLQAGKHNVALEYDGIKISKIIEVPMEETMKLNVDFTDEINAAKEKKVREERQKQKARFEKEQQLEKERLEKAAEAERIKNEKLAEWKRWGGVEFDTDFTGSFEWGDADDAYGTKKVKMYIPEDDYYLGDKEYYDCQGDRFDVNFDTGNAMLSFNDCISCKKSPCSKQIDKNYKPQDDMIFVKGGFYKYDTIIYTTKYKDPFFPGPSVRTMLSHKKINNLMIVVAGKVLVLKMVFDFTSNSIINVSSDYRGFNKEEREQLSRLKPN